MRLLTIIMLILAGLYGGYWVVGSRAVERGAGQALSQLQTSGWQVGYSDLSTEGFPSRFDTTLTDIDLRDPATGIGWQAPFFQVFALSYQPNKVIAVWPNTQTILLPDQTLAVTSTGLRASGSVELGTAMTLHTVTVESGAATVASDLGGQTSLQKLLFAIRPSPTATAANSYDIYLDADGIRVQPALPGDTSALFDLLRFDGSATFDKPIDRFAGQGQPPMPTTITVRDIRLTAGETVLSGSGALTVLPDGTTEGIITFSTGQWPELIDLAVQAGWIDAGVAPTWVNMGNMLAQGSDTLDLPLKFANGNMALGPLPLGPGPRFR